MAYHNKKFRLFVARTWAVAVLILANVAVFVACGAAALFHVGLTKMMQEPIALIAGAPVVVFCATLIAYRFDLQRGWNDVGFVGASFRAERNRVRGL
jgi:hypothetical protein